MPGLNTRQRVKLLNVRLQMIARCHDVGDPSFANYGGRGISVCERWRASPSAFIDDIGPRPDGMTIERIDNDGNYEPGNVRWATRAEQVRNRRNNIIVDVGGVAMVLADACVARGMPFNAVHKRLKRGWSATDALSVPLTRANRGRPRGQINEQPVIPRGIAA